MEGVRVCNQAELQSEVLGFILSLLLNLHSLRERCKHHFGSDPYFAHNPG